MKICEIIASYGKGGLENHFVDLCNGLAAHGHEVHVIASPLFSGPFNPEVIVHHVPMHWNRRNPFLLYRLYKTLRLIAPDIVHTHASKGTQILSTLKHQLPYPCVATRHNLKKRAGAYLKMDAVIGVSQGVLETIPHPFMRVIYNGLNLPAAPTSRSSLTEQYQLSGKRPIVVSIGRLVEAKNFSMLIEAWQGINADLIILGDGPLKKELHSQIRTLDLESTVHMPGFVNNASSVIPAVDLVVISSKREGFNYVMAEALLQAKPVLSTNVPAPNEILPSQYMVLVGDVQAMHHLIQACLSDLDSVDKDFQDLYLWAKQTFSLDSMVTSTETFFADIIQTQKQQNDV